MKRVFYLFIVLVLCFSNSYGNDGGGDDNSSNSSIVGEWSHTIENINVTVKMNLISEGTFKAEITVDNEHHIRTGTYTVSDNKITFNDDPNSGSSCTNPGIYNYSLNENQLTFTLVSDDSDACDGRKRMIIATWTKV